MRKKVATKEFADVDLVSDDERLFQVSNFLYIYKAELIILGLPIINCKSFLNMLSHCDTNGVFLQ